MYFFSSLGSSMLNHVKQPVSVRSRVCCRKAVLKLLDQLTNFGQRESLTIHTSSGSRQMSAVSSAQSVEMLLSRRLLPLDGAAQNGLGIKSS